MRKCLVILSGGMDSTIVLHLAVRKFHTVSAISFNYGQRHAAAELAAASSICEYAGIHHEEITIGNILLSTSPIIDQDAELEQYENFESMISEVGNRVEDTFVPMRNMLFMVVAANHALAKDCSHIGLGVCEADTANYPDCTKGFLSECMSAINASNGYDERKLLEIYAPLVKMTKAESVKLAYSMSDCWEALAYTHTSYDGEYPPTDNNHANILRAKAFEEAGLPDPLVLRAFNEGMMNLPTTMNYRIFRHAG